MSEKHEYPSKYPPGTHWALDEAWHVLDTLQPGRLSVEERAFLAGMITGLLVKYEHKRTKTKTKV